MNFWVNTIVLYKTTLTKILEIKSRKSLAERIFAHFIHTPEMIFH